MNALVTGCAGFVGSHLTQRLLRDGANVIGVDNLSTGNVRNLEGFAAPERFTFVHADVTDAYWEDQLPGAFPLDVVFHLASPASPRDYDRLPLETLRVNSVGTERAIATALRWEARFVLASTSEVYGDPLVHPQVETYWGNVSPNGPRSCYDEGKRFAEALVAAHRTTHGLDARVARIFNTYGPRMRASDGRVIPTFIDQALRGEPLTIYGSGRQTRSFTFVDDLVDGLVRLGTMRVPAAEATVNVGNPHETTVAELAEIVSRLCGVPLRVTNDELPPDDPQRRLPDIERARRILDWHPRTGLETGLRATLASLGAPSERSTREESGPSAFEHQLIR